MGIAPAVFMTNLHLMYYEYPFEARLTTIILDNPSLPGPSTDPGTAWFVRQLLSPEDPQVTPDFVIAHQSLWPDAAYAVLMHTCQFSGGYV